MLGWVQIGYRDPIRFPKMIPTPTNEPSKLDCNSRFFRVNDCGRAIMLRGVNLSGNAKSPTKPMLPSQEKDGFYDGENVSFVGRPFPLVEADEHFKRLKHWGFNFLRFNITWEAIEHKGP